MGFLNDMSRCPALAWPWCPTSLGPTKEAKTTPSKQAMNCRAASSQTERCFMQVMAAFGTLLAFRCTSILWYFCLFSWRCTLCCGLRLMSAFLFNCIYRSSVPRCRLSTRLATSCSYNCLLQVCRPKFAIFTCAACAAFLDVAPQNRVCTSRRICPRHRCSGRTTRFFSLGWRHQRMSETPWATS